MPNPAAAADSFPRWIALLSLVVVLWLFFGNTMPAAQERTELQDVLHHLDDLQRQFEAAITTRRLSMTDQNTIDLQAVLVAIDQHGLTPAELCATHPLPPAADGEADPRKFR